MTKDEALDLALEALEWDSDFDKRQTARAAIKQARAAPVQEPVAWPCVIAEADFEKNTVTLEMQCSDYKVGAGRHWLHTTPPAQPAPVQEPVAWARYPRYTGSIQKAEIVFTNPKGKDWLELYTTPPAQPAPVQEPVAFLANGTRFKISYDSRQSGGQIHGIPPELGGRWVAFVAAEDDCHLKLTTPPAAQRQWVGLTEQEAAECWSTSTVRTWQAIEAKLKEKNT